MRLTEKQINAIKRAFKNIFSESDHIWLFGSRVDDAKKGGDIDLYVETELADYAVIAKKKIDFLVAVKLEIGDQKIDLVVRSVHTPVLQTVHIEAKETGIVLL